MRTILLIPVFIIINMYNIFSQCTGNYKTLVVQFDIVVEVIPPVNSADSIQSFIHLLEVSNAVYNYLILNDTELEYINYQYLSPLDQVDETNYSEIAASQLLPPENTAVFDYYLSGSIIENSGNYQMTVYLKSGNTKETLAESAVSFSAPVNAEEVTASAMINLVTLWSKIFEYEKNIRNGGSPYAISPTVLLEPDKYKIGVNESTSVFITVKDCDGEPLAGRTLLLSAEGGSINLGQVATDEIGIAWVLFTAGSEPDIGLVQAELAYISPSGKLYSAKVNPCFIQISKPEEAWFITGTYHSTYRSKTKEDGSMPGIVNLQEGHTHTMLDVFFSAWINRLPVSQDTMTFAQTADPPLKLRYRTNETTISGGKVVMITSGGSSISQSMIHQFTGSVPGGSSVLFASIGDGTYGFGLNEIESQINGTEIQVYDYYDPIVGHQHDESTYQLTGDTHLNAYLSDYSCDTSYIITENDPQTGTSNVTTVVQSFFWNNKICSMDYTFWNKTEENMNYGGILEIDNESSTEISFKLTMSHDGNLMGLNEHSARENISFVDQNRPNPGSSFTRIPYYLNNPEYVSMLVYDNHGKLIMTVTEGLKYAGHNEILLDVSHIPNGIYYYQFIAGHLNKIRKMVISH